MKQGKLIRRAVSAALAGCMMFTLSAPALAESTDALMQLSMTRRSAVSVLDAENGDTVDYGITVTHGEKAIPVTSANCGNILGNGTLSYDPAAKKLTSNGTIYGLLSINAPGVDVELNGENFALQDSGLYGILTIENAKNVTVSSQYYAAVEKDVNVTCTGKLTVITNDNAWAAIGRNLTVHSAESVQIESKSNSAVGGDVKIECACPVTLKNNGRSSVASSISCPEGSVYYTSETGDTFVDPRLGTVPSGYVRIGQKTLYDINTAEDAAIKLQGQSTELKTAFAGAEVTVTAAGRENAEFTGWTAEGITLTDKQNPTVTFTMPGNNVTLTPNYNVVQDFGIEVGSENTTPTRVTSKNYKDILGNGVLSYDPTTQTLKSDGRIKRSSLEINAPGKDINLDGKDQIAVAAKLIVENAHNVKVSSDKYAAIFARDDTSTIDCTGKVDIRSGGDVVVNGNLSINNLGDVDLYANGNSISNKALTITSGGDVTIESTDGRAAKNLTINKAENVTITISDDERAVSENTDITASGTVILKNNAQGGRVGTVDFTQANDKAYVYYTSEAEDAKLIDPRIHPLAEAAEAAESSYLRIEPRETTYSITVANGTAQVDDDTTGLNTAFEGEKVTVTAAKRGAPWTFAFWTVDEGQISDLTEEELKNEILGFTMPKGNVKLTAHYSMPSFTMDMPVTVTDGTINDGTENPLLVQPGTPITVKAVDKTAEYKMFHHWKVEENVSPALGLTQGSLGSENEFGTEKITFTMPQEAVTLTAEYVKMHRVTADGGIGTASVSGSKTIDGRAAAGSTVKVSAELDGDKYPGMMFDQWEVVSPDGSAAEVKLADATSSETSFTMPDCEVTLVAHWIDGAMPEKPGTDNPDPDFDVDPVDDGSGAAGAIVAGAALGGAAVWGGYEVVTRVILNELLPEGAAIPANRGQLALLVWNTAGRPEPAAQPAFADVADPDMAKAAQWCVEQGTMATKGDRFEPEGWTPKFKVIEVWNKAFPKQ